MYVCVCLCLCVCASLSDTCMQARLEKKHPFFQQNLQPLNWMQVLLINFVCLTVCLSIRMFVNTHVCMSVSACLRVHVSLSDMRTQAHPEKQPSFKQSLHHNTKNTRKANACTINIHRTINIHHTNRTFLQSSLSHDQLFLKFWLLQFKLFRNPATFSEAKVVQTDTKMQGLVVSTTILSFEKSAHKCLNAHQCSRFVLQNHISRVLSLEYQSCETHSVQASTNQQVVIVEFQSKWAQKFLISETTMTLNDDQGHPNWYKNLEFRGLYHHIKFEVCKSVMPKCEPRLILFLCFFEEIG